MKNFAKNIQRPPRQGKKDKKVEMEQENLDEDLQKYELKHL